MPGHHLPLALARDLVDDAAAAGARDIRWYGGEPLLHADLPAMIAHTIQRGLSTYVTTNAVLLDRRIDELWDAGLRAISIGLYGIGERYDGYVQRRGQFARLEHSLKVVRERVGDQLTIRANWLLSRRSCDVAELDAAVEFARRYGMQLQIDIIHYSLPYFNEGPDRELQFRAEDRAAVERVRDALLDLAARDPSILATPVEGLRAIADWAIEGAAMRVPCDAGEMLWVGPDGTVQLCYVEFPLGNLHQGRLSELLFSPAHLDAARKAFRTECANCHCHYAARTARADGFRYR
ncbi:MAG: radical SAM protein [Gemmatimonadaceae bacterium]|nr:radical SAM protein [Gemmatimonadaceae bacterium]